MIDQTTTGISPSLSKTHQPESAFHRAGRSFRRASMSLAAVSACLALTACLLEDQRLGSPVSWQTGTISMQAEQLTIDIDGVRFHGDPATMQIFSEPGIPGEYSMLELTWFENGVEMQMNIYFTGDGYSWWIPAIYTSNGRPDGETIIYTASSLTAPFGQPYEGDITLWGQGQDGTFGSIELKNVRVQPFLQPDRCEDAETRYFLDIPHPEIHMTTQPDTSVAVRLFDAATCLEVADQTLFVAEWIIGAPDIVSATARSLPSCEPAAGEQCPAFRLDLSAISPGVVDLHVMVRVRESLEMAGLGIMRVTVTE